MCKGIMCACMLSCFSLVGLCVTLWPVAHQALLSMEFSRQEYWSGLPCPLQGIFLTQGLNPHLLHWQAGSFRFFFSLSLIYFNWRLITILWWFLPYIHMNQPWVHMCSPSWPFLPAPSPSHPSGSSQCTSPKHPVSCNKPGLAINFTCVNIHVSMLLSQIIPPLPPPTESKSLFFTSVSLLLSHI